MADVRDESYWCEQVFQRFEFSVVRLPLGNGFIVHAADGGSGTTLLILTCRHVVAGVPVGGNVAAYFSGSNDPHDATLLHADQGRDLALLRAREVLAPGPVTPLRFFDQEIVSGWNVVALSFIHMVNGAAILQPGTFSGQIINEPGDACLNCSCSSKAGASGSPIILAGVNEVVAVLAGSSLASVDGIPVSVIQAFLSNWLDGGYNMSANGLLILIAATR